MGARPPLLGRLAAGGLAVALVGSGAARADDPSAQCHVVDVDFIPGGIAPASDNPQGLDPQIVIWIEKPTGEYVDTIFITQETGLYGIGNRPGRFDFNSGPKWPYGRRVTVFPVWAHRKTPLIFPQVVFQNQQDDDLSHMMSESSSEMHFFRPIMKTEPEWDAGSVASGVNTDKGKLSMTAMSLAS